MFLWKTRSRSNRTELPRGKHEIFNIVSPLSSSLLSCSNFLREKKLVTFFDFLSERWQQRVYLQYVVLLYLNGWWGGEPRCGLAKVRVFFKGVGSPSLGNESTQRCKKKILIYCENDRLGAGKQQRTHVAMLIGWG